MIRRLVVALALLAGIAIAAPTSAQADHGPYVSHFNYMGTRWTDMTAPTCVEDRMNTVHAAGKSRHVAQAVWTSNTGTAANVWYRYGTGSCTGTPYKQRVILVDSYYGRDCSSAHPSGCLAWVDGGPVCSSIRTYHCIRWGRTPAGHWTWLFTRYVVVGFNLSWGQIPDNAHLWLHEVGVHVVMAIKDRPIWSTGNITCYSVAASCTPGNGWTYFVRPDTDIAWYDYIRAQ